MEELFLAGLMRGDYNRGKNDMADEKSPIDPLTYKALSPSILQVKHYARYSILLTDEFNFQMRQVTHICENENKGTVAIVVQNFRDIERKEAIDEMRQKLIDLNGDPDRFTGDTRKKQPLVLEVEKKNAR